jgi:hypothetical protein
LFLDFPNIFFAISFILYSIVIEKLLFMELTILGSIVIPISIGCFLLKPIYLLPLSIALSVFIGAAVFNISGTYPIGLQPFYFIISLFFLGFIFKKKYCLNFLRLKDENYKFFFLSLALFTAYSFISLSFPIIFSGIQVLTPRGGIDAIEEGRLDSLVFSMSNIPPLIYIIFNSLYIHISLRFIELIQKMEGKIKFLELLTRGFYISAVFVISVGLYQALCFATGLKFPDFIFYSSVAYSGGGDQTISSIGRVASTFTEPSLAGSFLAAFSIYLIELLLVKKTFPIGFLLILTILTLFLTTSTLGYTAFFLVLLIKIFFGLFNLVRRGALKKRNVLNVYIFFFALFVLLIVVFSSPFMQSILYEVIFNKSSSGSYLNRSASNEYSLILFFKTFGLGVGLGSHRPSSLLYFLLSNIGFIGTLLFLYVFVVFPVHTKIKISRFRESTKSLINDSVFNKMYTGYEQFYWAYLTYLISLFVANATIHESFMWITLMATCVYSHSLYTYISNARQNDCIQGILVK